MSVKVLGVRETLRALNDFQPKMAKEIRKEINDAAALVRNRARGYVPVEAPMSGWAVMPGKTGRWSERSFDSSEIKRGIKTVRGVESIRNGTGFNAGKNYAYSIRVENTTAAGMIYEGAGTVHPTGEDTSHGNRGKRFVESIAKTGLRIPLHRLVVRAGVEVGPQARKMYEHAVQRAERAIQRRVS